MYFVITIITRCVSVSVVREKERDYSGPGGGGGGGYYDELVGNKLRLFLFQEMKNVPPRFSQHFIVPLNIMTKARTRSFFVIKIMYLK